MKLIHSDEKHRLKIYKDKFYHLEHDGEMILEYAPADKVKELYNSIVNLHHKIEKR
jgi:hypothetical protein